MLLLRRQEVHPPPRQSGWLTGAQHEAAFVDLWGGWHQDTRAKRTPFAASDHDQVIAIREPMVLFDQRP